MHQNKSPHDRAKDLEFMRTVLQRGGPKNVYDGQVFFATIRSYPLELWYLCQEYHPAYYHRIVRVIAEEGIKKIKASLN